MANTGSEYVWTSIGSRRTRSHLSLAKYAHLIEHWAELARLNPKRYSTHSMPRPESAVIYDQFQNFAACQ